MEERWAESEPSAAELGCVAVSASTIGVPAGRARGSVADVSAALAPAAATAAASSATRPNGTRRECHLALPRIGDLRSRAGDRELEPLEQLPRRERRHDLEARDAHRIGLLSEEVERRLAVLVEAEAVDPPGLLEVDGCDARIVGARVRAVGAEGPREGHDGAVRDSLGRLACVHVLDRGAPAELGERLELAVVGASRAEVGEVAATAGIDARERGRGVGLDRPALALQRAQATGRGLVQRRALPGTADR